MSGPCLWVYGTFTWPQTNGQLKPCLKLHALLPQKHCAAHLFCKLRWNRNYFYKLLVLKVWLVCLHDDGRDTDICSCLPVYLLQIAPDMVLIFNWKVLIFFLFLHENICCGYSLEAPCQGASNEYPQPMFSWKHMLWVLIRSALPRRF